MNLSEAICRCKIEYDGNDVTITGSNQTLVCDQGAVSISPNLDGYYLNLPTTFSNGEILTIGNVSDYFIYIIVGTNENIKILAHEVMSFCKTSTGWYAIDEN